MIYMEGEPDLIGRIIDIEIMERSGNGLKARISRAP
jgi:hypothetical protein